jgi:anti-sigma factor RsiW
VDPWTDRLSEYLEDELEPAERVEAEQHLASCEACQAMLASLRKVVERAQSLQPRTPAADLWPAIERRLPSQRVRRTITFSFVELAAAAALLVALSGGLVWVLRSPASTGPAVAVDQGAPPNRQQPSTALPVSFADQTYDQAVSDLQRALDEGRARLDPDTVAIIEKNLQTIDVAIAQARRALDADPSNTYLNGHLADARRRKLALLRSVRSLTDPEG